MTGSIKGKVEQSRKLHNKDAVWTAHSWWVGVGWGKTGGGGGGGGVAAGGGGRRLKCLKKH